ncbi:hypothetical protein COU20_00925 [Candidatus Kaiserbacteria bacterium CG10_big_fil_rev_8_21_14_0_10_59_10]|uniref:LTD domain-containing protein n=1 Tax=Candidatus Kaiserbacteria bacterium CG10_big_fil_rev_8_21_14_0_10_59_10 TaxID=1974612 RepID=A0A2H0U8J8_9BACT|nr:MAG: hypothetical protein COU20_00925 [Candidatus Kaiserbacteria bacterium CG10_big_fil_rev_8_21_14_0_10_59_10]
MYVNGIFTNEQKARDDLFFLIEEFKRKSTISGVKMLNGYNPSHLAGAADLVQAVSQAIGKPVSNYDRDTILRQIHSEVKTRKILLVGHSQGTFYTNEMYDYLVQNGVPRKSISIYNLATPASRVAGSGPYLTSANDNLVNKVREWSAMYGSLPPLDANILIPVLNPDVDELWRGHSFSGEYLAGASARIVDDISHELARLVAEETAAPSNGCFTPPPMTLAQKVQHAGFVVGDPLASTALAVLQTTGAVAQRAYGAAGAAARIIGDALAHIFSTELSSASAQGAAAALAIASPQPQSDQPDIQSTETSNTLSGEGASQLAFASDVAPPPPPQSPEPPPAPPPSETPQPETTDQESTPQPSEPPIMPLHGSGGGSPTPVVQQPDEAEESVSSEAEESVPIAILSPTDGDALANASFSVIGTSTPNAAITVRHGEDSYETEADDAGDWTLPLDLEEGTHELSFVARVGEKESDALPLSITIDLTAPEVPTLSVVECGSSLAVGGCLIPTDEVTVSWELLPSASSYAVVVNGEEGEIVQGSEQAIQIEFGATTTLALVAYDAAGNRSPVSHVEEVRAETQPLVINEVGWGGSWISSVNRVIVPQNQWIEILNTTEQELDVSQLSISRTGGAPIQLTGIVQAHGALAIIPHSSTEVSGKERKFVFTGQKVVVPFEALSVDGEQLSLLWNAAGGGVRVLDSTPEVAACGGWCEGAALAEIGSIATTGVVAKAPLSMERKQGAADGTSPSSWQRNDSYAASILGYGGEVWGTPGQPNSAALPEAGIYCGERSNLLAAGDAPVPFDPGDGKCELLSRFVSLGKTRWGYVFKGEVGNAEEVKMTVSNHGFTHLGIGLAKTVILVLPEDVHPGDTLFFALWEGGGDGHKDDFLAYFSDGSAEPPHQNFRVVPWVYQPE